MLSAESQVSTCGFASFNELYARQTAIVMGPEICLLDRISEI